MAKKRAKSPTKNKGKAKRSRVAAKPSAVPAASLDAFIDAAARALDLPVAPDWKPAVKTNLEVTLRLAALFADFPLPDDAEPAPIFVA
jgi:Protein of unknown function (DUF4089)